MQGVPTNESESAGVAVEGGMGGGSHGGSDEPVEVESAENKTDIKSEDDAEGEKEDLEVHEQVAGLAGVEAMEAESHGGSEKRVEKSLLLKLKLMEMMQKDRMSLKKKAGK